MVQTEVKKRFAITAIGKMKMNKRNRSSIRKKAEAKTSSGKQISQIEIVYAAQIERLGKRRTFLDQGDKHI